MLSKFKLVPVTAIIPCFCCAETIEVAIKSILDQTCVPEEIILVNDGSNDNNKTKNKITSLKNNIKKINKEIDIKFINLLKNKGPAFARNIGWNKASSKYIAFLDADDFWNSKKIELQYNWMKKNTSFDVICHKISLSDYSCKKIETDKLCIKKILINHLVFKNYFKTSSVMLKANIKWRFDESRRFGEDYDLWLKLIKDYNMYFFNIILAYSLRKDFSEGGLSSNLIEMEKNELKSIFLVYSKKHINFLLFFLAILFSLLKFTKRLMVYFLR